MDWKVNPGRRLRIGELADRSGVPAKTIRFWEAERLLPAAERTATGYRTYEPPIVERLAFIRQAQAAGFRLDQIRRVLDVGDAGEPPCEHVAQLIEDRLREVEARLAELETARAHLRTLAARAAAQDPAACSGHCSILLDAAAGR